MGVMAAPPPSFAQSSLPRFGVGFKGSSLGVGVEGAAAVTRRSNIRFGFNAFSYNRLVDKRGIPYDASLKLRSLQVTYDHYFVDVFHVSPGLLVYNGNKVDATVPILPGESFTVGNVQYYSNPTNPINGTANVKVNKIAPMILLGFGNPLPRTERRLGINFDFGVAFQGSPNSTLNLNGTACVISPATGCLDAGADPTVQSNVREEEARINDDLKEFKYYPVLSFGVTWGF
jgi:hypothetical protein